MDLNALEDITDRHKPASEAKHRDERRVDEESRVGNIKLIGTIYATETISTPASLSLGA